MNSETGAPTRYSEHSLFARPSLRLTIGVAEVASEASNLSEARRGARASYTPTPARVRVSEQMERSGMVRERARTEHRSRTGEERSGYV
jgi:hypothetical protein